MIIFLTITSRLHQVTGQFFLHPNLYFDQLSTRKTGHLRRTTKNELRPLLAEFHCNIVQCIQQSSPDLSNHFWTLAILNKGESSLQQMSRKVWRFQKGVIRRVVNHTPGGIQISFLLFIWHWNTKIYLVLMHVFYVLMLNCPELSLIFNQCIVYHGVSEWSLCNTKSVFYGARLLTRNIIFISFTRNIISF